MRKTVIILFLLTFGAYEMNAKDNTNYFRVDEIKKGKYLEFAKPVDFPFFFNKRMENPQASKYDGRRWEILYEDNDFVYTGILYHRDQIPGVIELYKVPKLELVKMFPKYTSIEGYQIRDMIYDSCIKKKLTKYSKHASSEKVEYKYKLTDSSIEVVADYFSRVELFWKVQFTVNVVFDKNNLTIISRNGCE